MGFIPVGGIRGVVDRTRRGLLGLLAATTGCLGFGGNDEVTPGEVTDSPAATPTASPTNTPVATNSPSPDGSATATASPTETESPTAMESPTPTPRDAQAPPPGSLALLNTQIFVRAVEGGVADVFARLANTGEGDAAFRLVEMRFDLSYESPFTGRSEVVASGAFERRFDDDLLSPGDQTRIGGRLRLRDASLDGTEADRRFSLDVAYRRVVY